MGLGFRVCCTMTGNATVRKLSHAKKTLTVDEFLAHGGFEVSMSPSSDVLEKVWVVCDLQLGNPKP